MKVRKTEQIVTQVSPKTCCTWYAIQAEPSVCEVVLRVRIADSERSVLSMMCFRSFPDLLLSSARTSTKAGEIESMTASQSEHKKRNEKDEKKRNKN